MEGATRSGDAPWGGEWRFPQHARLRRCSPGNGNVSDGGEPAPSVASTMRYFTRAYVSSIAFTLAPSRF